MTIFFTKTKTLLSLALILLEQANSMATSPSSATPTTSEAPPCPICLETLKVFHMDNGLEKNWASYLTYMIPSQVILLNLALCFILLFVSTKDAVTTTVLSKRWRFIWTMMPTLEYKESKDDDESKKSVWWFLDQSLQLHKAPVLDSLCIKLGPQCPVHVDVVKWVAKAIDRFVRTLKFELIWSADPIRLPKSLYTCETLVKLNLSHKVLIDCPSSPACLPSLKKLYLINVVYKDEASLVRFLSSCPVLEILVVKREEHDNLTDFYVIVPSLRDLLYHDLKYIKITNCSKYYCLIKNMPCVDSAYISIATCADDRLPRSISSVLFLRLFLSDEMLVRCSTINFSRLTELIICPDESAWLEPLTLLLGNSPKLKKLLVDYESTENPEDLPLSWNQPSSVPGCLSSHLEIFERVEDYGGRVEEKEFVTYILANSKCLRRATISLRSTFNLEEKQKVIEELESIPRVSKSSQLLLK